MPFLSRCLDPTTSTSSYVVVTQASHISCAIVEGVTRVCPSFLLFSAEHCDSGYVQETGDHTYKRQRLTLLQRLLRLQETVFHCHGSRYQICASTI